MEFPGEAACAAHRRLSLFGQASAALKLEPSPFSGEDTPYVAFEWVMEGGELDDADDALGHETHHPHAASRDREP